MNVVFLSPHFPPQLCLYCRRLREAGASWQMLPHDLDRLGV